MLRNIVFLIVVLFGVVVLGFKPKQLPDRWAEMRYADSIRQLYSQPIAQWPKPMVDSGVQWLEMGPVPTSPIATKRDSLKAEIELGKILFFDPRLSGSNQISCSSCHHPDLNWADGKEKAVGHDHNLTRRNAPSVANAWFFSRLFWDGRAKNLMMQSLKPMEAPGEMHTDLKGLPGKLKQIKGYANLFNKAFGSDSITHQKILRAISTFEQTIVSRPADFDAFVGGKYDALEDDAVVGLHLFRTKGKCMNCHHGPMLSDGQFHNLGLHKYGNKEEDLGLYYVTKNKADYGKFKTPVLRDVARTGPWMHDGSFNQLDGLMEVYSNGMKQPKPKKGQEADPYFPKTDPLIHVLHLTTKEQKQLVRFLESISSISFRMVKPDMPK
jgi:cytochrome c peroxidase